MSVAYERLITRHACTVIFIGLFSLLRNLYLCTTTSVISYLFWLPLWRVIKDVYSIDIWFREPYCVSSNYYRSNYYSPHFLIASAISKIGGGEIQPRYCSFFTQVIEKEQQVLTTDFKLKSFFFVSVSKQQIPSTPTCWIHREDTGACKYIFFYKLVFSFIWPSKQEIV